jgi:predicted phosphate transport protein (TIGR00153 family)
LRESFRKFALTFKPAPESTMFDLFFKKGRQVETLIYSYLENLGLTQEHFLKAMDMCLKEGVCDDFVFLVEHTHKYESKADDIRDEVNLLMYGRALIPESREDIMGLLEEIDGIPRHLEQVLNMIRTQKLTVPEFLVLDVRELLRVSIESCDLLIRQVGVMLRKEPGIRSLMSTIDQNESHCDHIERRIIIKIFDSNLDPFVKLQLKEMVLIMGDISDQADRVSKRINIITLKRRV